MVDVVVLERLAACSVIESLQRHRGFAIRVGRGVHSDGSAADRAVLDIPLRASTADIDPQRDRFPAIGTHAFDLHLYAAPARATRFLPAALAA